MPVAAPSPRDPAILYRHRLDWSRCCRCATDIPPERRVEARQLREDGGAVVCGDCIDRYEDPGPFWPVQGSCWRCTAPVEIDPASRRGREICARCKEKMQ